MALVLFAEIVAVVVGAAAAALVLIILARRKSAQGAEPVGGVEEHPKDAGPPPAMFTPSGISQPPASLEAESLEPASSVEVPILNEPVGFETGEAPVQPDEKPRYRTPAAQALADAIESMTCPKCGSPTFAGRATPETAESGDVAMFKLEARCGACGHKEQVIDMRIG